MALRAGLFEYRVTLERATEAQDPAGAPIQVWNPLAVRWADVDPLTGRELFDARQFSATVSYRIRLRADALTRTLVPKDRIRLGPRVFDLESVTGLEARCEQVECLAREVV